MIIPYHKTQQNTARIARANRKVLISRCFVRAVLHPIIARRR